MSQMVNLNELHRWMKAILADAELTPAQKIVLIRLALHFSIRDGRCDPSIRTLAAGTNLSDRAVRIALARGEALGRLVREIGGGNHNHTNRYSLTAPPLDGGAGVNSDAPLNGDAALPLNGHSATPAPPFQTPLNGGAAKQCKKNSEGNSDASRNGSDKNSGAGKTYAFQGQVVRLLLADLERWRRAYPNIPDIAAELQHADDYYAGHLPPDGEWFHRVSAWLKRENGRWAQKNRAADRERDSW